MEDNTATAISVRMNVRRRRSDELVAVILDKIRPLVEHEQMKDICYALGELFEKEGWEVITDLTRQEMGLSPRDGEGWTRAEIVALEMKRLEIMMPRYRRSFLRRSSLPYSAIRDKGERYGSEIWQRDNRVWSRSKH